jgi:ribosomal protein S3
MLSVDQFLRLISLPAVVAAFLIASQISGGVSFRPALMQMASK